MALERWMAGFEKLVGEYLARAKEAEEQALRCPDAILKQSFQRIALSYREMAQHHLDAKTGGATSKQPSPLPASKAEPQK